MSIVTKTGDKGETSLVGGERVPKNHERVDVYGTVDELNSFIGLAITTLDEKLFKNEIIFLTWLQNRLFDMGSVLASLPATRVQYKLKELDESYTEEIEKQIALLEPQLPKLQEFILPGGTRESAHFHVCRTIARRLERELVTLNKSEADPQFQMCIKFTNRLSDYFFVVARFANFLNKSADVVWKK